jgi:type IV secretory pathway protease TraF
MAERARLRRNGRDVDSLGGPPVPNDEIVTVAEQTWASLIFGWVRSIAIFALLVGLTGVILYTLSASTVIFAASVNSHVYIVARGTFVGDVAPVGHEVYISETTPDSRTLVSRLQTGYLGADKPAIVKIRSGLYDTVGIQDGQLYVNNKAIGSSGNLALQGGRLSQQYVVECVSGACGTPGAYQVIAQRQVYGEVKRG